MTMHVSKGLNLDLVFLPFAALKAGGGGRNSSPRLARYHDGERRVARMVVDGDDPACAQDEQEAFAEHIRVLYVALTRARFATWVGWG